MDFVRVGRHTAVSDLPIGAPCFSCKYLLRTVVSIEVRETKPVLNEVAMVMSCCADGGINLIHYSTSSVIYR